MHEHLFSPVFSRCGFQSWHRLVWSVTWAEVLPLDRERLFTHTHIHVPVATSNSNGVGLGGVGGLGGNSVNCRPYLQTNSQLPPQSVIQRNKLIIQRNWSFNATDHSMQLIIQQFWHLSTSCKSRSLRLSSYMLFLQSLYSFEQMFETILFSATGWESQLVQLQSSVLPDPSGTSTLTFIRRGRGGWTGRGHSLS